MVSAQPNCSASCCRLVPVDEDPPAVAGFDEVPRGEGFQRLVHRFAGQRSSPPLCVANGGVRDVVVYTNYVTNLTCDDAISPSCIANDHWRDSRLLPTASDREV